MRSPRAYDGDLEIVPPHWASDAGDITSDTDAFRDALDLCRAVREGCAEPARRARNRLRPLEERVQTAWHRCVRPARRVHDWYRVAIGAHRGFDPRRHPHVRRNIEREPEAVVELIATTPIARCGNEPGPTLRIEPRLVEHRDVECAHQAAARLHIPWSYPDLPMSLSVIEWSRDQCVLDLTLRSRRRIRYPLRYYSACHRVLAELGDEIERARHPGCRC